MKKIVLTIFGFSLISGIWAQNIVSTVASQKNAIIEEFSGIKCGNCPAGHTELENITAANQSGKVWVVQYSPDNSSYTDPSGTAGTDFQRPYLDAFYTSSWCSPGTGSRFMPSALINRQIWTDGNRLQSRTNWSSYVTSVLAENSPLNIGIKSTYNASANSITVDVEVYFTADVIGGQSFYVHLMEDGLTSDYQSGSSASASNPYVYEHTFREDLTGQWGDAITGTTNAGDLFSTQIIYDLSTTQDPIADIAKTQLIAFVVDDATGEVHTGLAVDIDGGQGTTGGTASGIEFADKVISAANVYPNPSSGNVAVSIVNPNLEQVTLSVYNMLGETIFTDNASTQNTVTIDAEKFPVKGVYFVHVEIGTERHTKKLVIN